MILHCDSCSHNVLAVGSEMCICFVVACWNNFIQTVFYLYKFGYHINIFQVADFFKLHCRHMILITDVLVMIWVHASVDLCNVTF